MELHELTAGYALDALDPSDRGRYEEHLATCEPCRAELQGFWQVTGALGRVERVERIAGGQLVNVHEFLSAPSSSSCRNRDRPENILLLIVPSGSPSRSASSDCV